MERLVLRRKRTTFRDWLSIAGFLMITAAVWIGWLVVIIVAATAVSSFTGLGGITIFVSGLLIFLAFTLGNAGTCVHACDGSQDEPRSTRDKMADRLGYDPFLEPERARKDLGYDPLVEYDRE